MLPLIHFFFRVCICTSRGNTVIIIYGSKELRLTREKRREQNSGTFNSFSTVQYIMGEKSGVPPQPEEALVIH